MDKRVLVARFENARVKAMTRPMIWLASHGRQPGFDDMSDMPDDAVVPPLDRSDVDESTLTPDQLAWRRDGVLIKPGLIPDEVTDAYIRVRERHHDITGWQSPTPYCHVPELKALSLYPPLMAVLKSLMSKEMFLHLNLTGWISTQRDWHQDDYLNPSHVNGWYQAVWIALDEIHPDSGPFEYIPGSHRWPVLRGDKIRSKLSWVERNIKDIRSGSHYWPKLSERLTTPAIEDKIARSGIPSRSFLAKKGDVLVWHARLVHRGSVPRNFGLQRKALIAHYSAVGHRPDLPAPVQDENGQWYAPFDKPLV